MIVERHILDRVPPRQQKEWDIRGALNFIFGGAGAGLLFATACATPSGADLRVLIALGLVLVGAGLFCVWLKIGRPWRALHVFRRPSTSWMTREAWLSLPLFACGALAFWFQSPLSAYAAGVLGLVYAYAQGRILRANIGIPAWRRWSLVAMIVATALTEGFGILALATPALPVLRPFGYGLAVLALLRLFVWRTYIDDLRRTGAPVGTLKAFDELNTRFLIGNVLAIILASTGAWMSQPLLLGIGGGFALFGGSFFKYVLVCRAAFTQGFALPHSPSRGKGRPGAGVQPGWQAGQRP